MTSDSGAIHWSQDKNVSILAPGRILNEVADVIEEDQEEFVTGSSRSHFNVAQPNGTAYLVEVNSIDDIKRNRTQLGKQGPQDEVTMNGMNSSLVSRDNFDKNQSSSTGFHGDVLTQRDSVQKFEVYKGRIDDKNRTT